MKNVLGFILIKLLYLTPIGYLISLFHLQLGDYTPGVYVQLARDHPIKAFVKERPTFNDKFSWFLSGLFLLFQAGFLVTVNRSDGGIGLTFAWIATIFGVVSLVSSLNPGFNWNKKLFLIRITILELLVILSLIILSAYVTAPQSVLESLNLK